MNTATNNHNGPGEPRSSPGAADNTFPCADTMRPILKAMDGCEPVVEPSVELLRAAAQ